MKTQTTIYLSALALMIFTACHENKKAPSGQVDVNAPAYAPDIPTDSTVIKPIVDPNAVDGVNVIKYPNGVIKAKGSFSAGKKVGEWQSFYPSGKLWSDEYFNHGYPDGTIQVLYENGKTMYQGQYRIGKPYGIWKFWGKDSDTPRIADYDKKAPNTAM